jgi:hypothetical protein
LNPNIIVKGAKTMEYIKAPTKENRKILSEINKIKKETYIEIFSYSLFYIVTSPGRLLYRKLKKLKVLL